jgi:hypothetical protein
VIRELAGDLVVHLEELAQRGIPYFEPGLPLLTPEERQRAAGNTRERFLRFTTACARLFELAIATGLAAEVEPVPGEIRTALAEHAEFIAEVWGHLEEGLRYIGHEYGYFYGGQPWDELCVARSALEFLRELSGGPLELTGDTEALMAQYGIEMFEQLPIPDGMPARHWWWFRDSP